MRLSTALLCASILLATPAAAQPTTEDGIRAVLRGDYRAAHGSDPVEREPLMRARLFLTAAALIAIVCGVSGQTGTADGVATLARGDYQARFAKQRSRATQR